jgi:hypothetical protein
MSDRRPASPVRNDGVEIRRKRLLFRRWHCRAGSRPERFPVALRRPGTYLRALHRLALAEECLLPTVAFVGRCSGAATVAYLVSVLAGLPHPVWATMSALIVSEEKFEDTHRLFTGRVLGTLVGIIVGVSASIVAAQLIDMAAQIALSVGICAVIARAYPAMRVCMWTGPIVLLTAEGALPTTEVALFRGSEVILGALVGLGFHWATEAIVLRSVRGLAIPLRMASYRGRSNGTSFGTDPPLKRKTGEPLCRA